LQVPKVRKPACECQSRFLVEQARQGDYARIKAILNKGRHPTFIGRSLVANCTRNGGGMIFTFDGQDVAVAVVNPKLNVLLVLNVLPEHRSHGLGAAVVRYLQCNFARVVESAVPWFERQGYQRIGKTTRGKKLLTQVMVKASLIPLAGRIARILCHE
jgi:GNAT superfamily N-acetyltransferase